MAILMNPGGELLEDDMRRILRRMPRKLLEQVKQHRAFLGGGAIRSIILDEPISDWDLFAGTKDACRQLANDIAHSYGEDGKVKTHISPNAITVVSSPRTPVQIITRWNYKDPELLIAEFDFTMARAVVWYDRDNSKWVSMCDPLYYPDIASRRLRYMEPKRDEDAGGSLLRAMKFLRRGYHISPEDMAKVIYRMTKEVRHGSGADPVTVYTALMREVDPLYVVEGMEPQDDVL